MGFADGLTHVPFTDTSVAELLRESLDLNNLVDHCSYPYRAGHSFGESTGTVISGAGLIRAALTMGALPAQAIFGSWGRGMASLRDVWNAVTGIRNAATVGSRAGREVGERIGESLVGE